MQSKLLIICFLFVLVLGFWVVRRFSIFMDRNPEAVAHKRKFRAVSPSADADTGESPEVLCRQQQERHRSASTEKEFP